MKFLALKVEDATSAWEETTKRGGKSFMEPVTLTDDSGEVVMSGIHTYGATIHLFIERRNYNGVFMPGFRKWESTYNPPEAGLQYVDHCVGNVGWNQMNPWVKFYEDVMGFRNILTFDDKISAELRHPSRHGQARNTRRAPHAACRQNPRCPSSAASR